MVSHLSFRSRGLLVLFLLLLLLPEPRHTRDGFGAYELRIDFQDSLLLSGIESQLAVPALRGQLEVVLFRTHGMQDGRERGSRRVIGHRTVRFVGIYHRMRL